MFQKNLKDGKQYNYYSIESVIEPGKPLYFIAWFYEDINDNFTGKIKEIIGEVDNGGG